MNTETIDPGSFVSHAIRPSRVGRRLTRRVGRLSATLCSVVIAVPAWAATIGPQNINCMGQNVGTLSVFTEANVPAPNGSGVGGAGQNGDIYATLTTANIGAAATQCWGGHFNWLNVVRSTVGATTPDDPSQPGGQQVATPFIDPLSGGNKSPVNPPAANSDDTLPFYWAEAAPIAGELGMHTLGNVLEFIDQPNNNNNSMVNFETYLVSIPGLIGQTANMNFHILGGFSWTFNEDAANNDSITNLAFIAGALGAANIAQLNMDLGQAYNFPGWSVTSITNHPLPVPAAAYLFVTGLILLLRFGGPRASATA